ncbi:MAG TPA: ABC transporter substrate-binding protein, partial [Stellaceae bacterium]|nr:ABC transporter substrate-binding protein [Stellaceae bacterium]
MRPAHLTLALGVLALTLGAAQAEPRQLKLIMFHGIGGLPVYVAQDKGFFAKYGLAADVTYTPTSDFQRKSLAEGKFDIAPTGADNAVFMVDTGVADVILVAGGDNSMNELLVRPGLGSYDDIRGKAVVVDAPNTAFAFQLYKMLELKGVKRGEYTVVSKGGTPQRLAAMKEDPNNAAAMIGTPFNIAAEKEGFRSLGNVTEVLGPYQGGAVAVLRSWAKANSATLIRFLKAEIAAQRWAFDPKNRAELAEILGKREKLDPETIRAGIEAAVGGAKPGLDRDLRFDLVGFREVLRLRAEFAGKPGAKPPSPNK